MKFKKTEIGSIPFDWEVVSLGEIGSCIIGLTYSPNDVSNHGTLVLRSSNVQGNKLAFHDNVYVNKLIPGKLRVKKDDILICVRNGSRDLIGKCALLDERVDNQTFGAFMSVFRTNHARYVFQSFQSNIVKRQIDENLGATINQITNKVLNSFRISLPPTLTEQKAIATALSDVDELIANLEKLIEKKKAIKQGAMQQLLTPPHKGGKRLDGFSGEWVETELGNISTITGAGVDKKINPDEPKVTLLNYLDIYRRDYLYRSELNHIVSAPEYKLINCNVRKGDVFLTPSSELRTEIGISALSMENMRGVVYSYHIYRLRYFVEFDHLFGLFILKTKSFLAQAETLCEGSGKRYVVSMGKFLSMKVFIPLDIEEQRAIGKVLFEMDLEVGQLERKLHKYISIKQGMLQELLTGRTRLV